VGTLDRGQAMGDGQGCPPRHEALDGFLHQALALGI
jgi:hypothetical protein